MSIIVFRYLRSIIVHSLTEMVVLVHERTHQLPLFTIGQCPQLNQGRERATMSSHVASIHIFLGHPRPSPFCGALQFIRYAVVSGDVATAQSVPFHYFLAMLVLEGSQYHCCLPPCLHAWPQWYGSKATQGS